MAVKQLVVCAAAALVALVSAAEAQPVFPLRTKADSRCVFCPGTLANLPTTGWGNPDTTAPASQWPIATYLGRWCDASFTRDHQGSFRTARAYDVKFSPDGKRVYVLLGNAVAAYTASTFFSRQEAKEAMVSSATAPMSYPNSRFGPYEYYLQWERFFHADNTPSGWNCPLTDGQDRLIDFDVDDKGRVYLAYSKFGWGLVQDDGSAGGATLMSNIMQDFNITNVWGLPTKICALKGASGYYALVSSAGNPQTKVFKIVDPKAPAEQAALAMAPYAYAKGSDRVAIITPDQTKVLIFDIDEFVSGAKAPIPAQAVTAADGGVWGAITSDGTNFYAVSSAPLTNAGTISSFVANSAVKAASYTRYDLAMNEPFLGLTAKSGAGFVTFVGFSGQARVARMYRIAGTTLVPFQLGNTLTSYYGGAIPAGYVGPQYGTIFTIHPWRISSRLYLVVAANGLGDTYELNDIGALAVATPAVAAGGAYFYGDEVALLATTGVATERKGLTWTFGDGTTEAGYTSETKSHRYWGFTTSLPAVLKVTAALSDGTATAQTSLALAKPHAKFQYPVRDGSSTIRYLVAQPNATASPVILAGDSFTDYSDGDSGGHFLEWAIGAFGDALSSATKYFTTHAQSQSALACGSHSLWFTSHYKPFTTPDAASTANAGFAATLDPASDGNTTFNYQVKAIVSAVTYTEGTDLLTFTSSSYAVPTLAGASITYKWELVDSNGVTRYTGRNSITGADAPVVGIANVPSWPFSLLQGGTRVDLTGYSARLTVGSTGSAAGCASQDMVTLGRPTAATALLTGSCSTKCEFAVTAAGNEMSGAKWKFAWTARNTNTGAIVDVAAAKDQSTFLPEFTQSGSYYVTVTVSNALGSVLLQSASYAVNGTCQLTPGSTIFINDPSCSGSNCSFSIGYAPVAPTCPITYAWTIDGAGVSGSGPTLSYGTSSIPAGQHTVGCTATVTGSGTSVNLGTKTFNVACQVSPGSNIYLNDPNCANRVCTFSIGFGSPAPNCSLSYNWAVDGSTIAGDGTSVTYSTAGLAAGQHTVSCSVTASGSSAVMVGAKTFSVVESCPTLVGGSNVIVNAPYCYEGNCSFGVTTPSTCSNLSYSWKIDGNTIAGAGGATYSTTSLTAGEHTVSVTVSGLTSTTAGPRTFTVPVPTSACALVKASNIFIGEESCAPTGCSFLVTTYGLPAACPLTYAWTMDGKPVAAATGSSLTYGIILAKGQHTVACTVKSPQSTVVLDRVFTLSSSVGAGILPEVDIRFASAAIVGTPVRFVPVVTPPEFVPVTYTWSVYGLTGKQVGQSLIMRDGTPFDYTFASTGRFMVSLTVDGAVTSGSKTVAVDVTLPARRRPGRR